MGHGPGDFRGLPRFRWLACPWRWPPRRPPSAGADPPPASPPRTCDGIEHVEGTGFCFMPKCPAESGSVSPSPSELHCKLMCPVVASRAMPSGDILGSSVSHMIAPPSSYEFRRLSPHDSLGTCRLHSRQFERGSQINIHLSPLTGDHALSDVLHGFALGRVARLQHEHHVRGQHTGSAARLDEG